MTFSPKEKDNPVIDEFNQKAGKKVSKTHGDCGLFLACVIYYKACYI